MSANPMPSTAQTHKKKRDLFAVLYWILAVGVFTFLFAPIVVIVIYSFNDGRLLGAWQGFGFKAYHRAVTDQTIRDAVKISLISGVFASLLATTLGTIGGVLLARTRSKWALILTGLLAITLVTPEIIDAVFCHLGHRCSVAAVQQRTSATRDRAHFGGTGHGHVHGASQDGWDGPGDRRSRLRSLCLTMESLPPSHLAHGATQHHGRSPDGLHPEPRQHRRVVIRGPARIYVVAGLPLRHSSYGYAARSGSSLSADVDPHPWGPGAGRGGAQTQW